MKRTGKLTTAVAVAAAFLLLVDAAGCANVGEQPATPGRALTSKERAVLDDAEQLLVRRCMRETGFEVYITEPPPQPSDLPYGNDSVAFARKHGLGLGLLDVDAYRANHPNTRYVQGLSVARRQAYGQALHGRPGVRVVAISLPTGYTVQQNPTGCTAKAQGVLYGGFERWFRVSTFVGNLAPIYSRKVATDKRYLDALAGWRTCMRERGHAVESPAELRARFTERFRSKALEVEAAVAEAQCATKTRLVGIGKDLETTYRKQVYQDNRQLITDYQALSVAALKRARTITETQ